MRTEFEKYLKSHGPELDVEIPDDDVIWEGIRAGIHPERKGQGSPRLRIWMIAAVSVLAFCLDYLGHSLIADDDSHRFDISSIDPELGAIEERYRSLVSDKMNEIRPAEELHNPIITELFEEIEKLDTIYAVTLKDLHDMGYNEQAVNTLFDTYEKKIYLLNLIILESNKINNHEPDIHLFL